MRKVVSLDDKRRSKEEQLQPGEHAWGPQLTGQVKEYDKKVLQEEE
jgi:hypothetical protein